MLVQDTDLVEEMINVLVIYDLMETLLGLVLTVPKELVLNLMLGLAILIRVMMPTLPLNVPTKVLVTERLVNVIVSPITRV